MSDRPGPPLAVVLTPGQTGDSTKFERALYRERNVVERLTGHLKEHHRIGLHSEKLEVSCRAMGQLAFIDRYLSILESPYKP